MAHAWLRHLLERRLGPAGRAVVAWRTREQAEVLLASRGLADSSALIAEQLGDRVSRGPFAGMIYPRRRGDIVHAAKLLGAYECELHAPLERLLARAPARVVNIGSGDGYYVVGIARRLPAAAVIAVDPDPLAQYACAATARLNAVASRLTAAPLMDADALQAALAASPALCLVDCEGYEDDLLDLVRAPALAGTDILVETHDFARAGVAERLASRFAATHDVEHIAIAARDTVTYAELRAVPRDIAIGLLDEFRHLPQAWLLLTARVRHT